ncbi:hypothetical protein [Saccharothrix sp. ST-888]|uniref:hypothetical protein n=1 Tax=Saccharothrix sp. ST-888 TaxID=1427391 RepID=UPI0005EC5E15|nr:hypothetical protein [Saccharothrix sp. ST-888]KJK56120.1 hypothetical protein UK12_24585 [Saccharothrix sp. ST-888]
MAFYLVITERWSRKPGDQQLNLIGDPERKEHQWPDDVARQLVAVLREHDARFSGMEEFGQGACDECDGTEAGLECCTRVELESCRERIERRLDEFKDEESEHFHLNVNIEAYRGFISIQVTYYA